MLGPDAQLIFPDQLLVLGYEAPAMGDLQAAAASGDVDGLPDEGEGHRVTIGLEADEVVLGHAPGLTGLEAERGLARGSDEMTSLADEAIRRAFVRGAVDPDIGDLALPLAELLAQVLLIDERAAREEVPLEILHACQRSPHSEPLGSGKLSHPGSPILSQAGSPIVSHPGAAIVSHPGGRDRSSFANPQQLCVAVGNELIAGGDAHGWTEGSGD